MKTSQLELIAVCFETHTKYINTLCAQNVELLGAFANLRNETISFVVSVCQSLRPHGSARLLQDGFLCYLIFEYFSTVCGENYCFKKLTRISWHFTLRRIHTKITFLSFLLRMRGVFVEKTKHTLFSIKFFFYFPFVI